MLFYAPHNPFDVSSGKIVFPEQFQWKLREMWQLERSCFSRKSLSIIRVSRKHAVRNRYFYLSLVLCFANSVSLFLRKENPNSAAHRKLYYCNKFRCPKCRQSKSAPYSRAFTFSTSTLRRLLLFQRKNDFRRTTQCARTERDRE